MTFLAEKAGAARWIAAEADRLPPAFRPNVAREWQVLEDELEGCRSNGDRELAVIHWRARMRQRLTSVHRPLEGEL